MVREFASIVDQVTFSTPKRKVRENSQVAITARFRVRATGDSTPTNIFARLDNLTTGCQIRDWTSVTLANPATITITPTESKLTGCGIERLQVTVAADYALSTQFVDTYVLDVENVRGIV
jgi:hypothetical protein